MFSEGILFLKKKITTRLLEYLRNYYTKVMSLPDAPKKIATGVALGVAFDFLPIPIISIPLSYLVARLICCSTLAAPATVVVLKPLVPVFFAFDLLIGKLLCGSVPETSVTISGYSFLGPFLAKIVEHGYPFLVGSLVNATVFSVVVYFLLLNILERRRRDKKEPLNVVKH
jgi:uncharacterized protein (DUF2062 family)